MLRSEYTNILKLSSLLFSIFFRRYQFVWLGCFYNEENYNWYKIWLKYFGEWIYLLKTSLQKNIKTPRYKRSFEWVRAQMVNTLYRVAGSIPIPTTSSTTITNRQDLTKRLPRIVALHCQLKDRTDCFLKRDGGWIYAPRLENVTRLSVYREWAKRLR